MEALTRGQLVDKWIDKRQNIPDNIAQLITLKVFDIALSGYAAESMAGSRKLVAELLLSSTNTTVTASTILDIACVVIRSCGENEAILLKTFKGRVHEVSTLTATRDAVPLSVLELSDNDLKVMLDFDFDKLCMTSICPKCSSKLTSSGSCSNYICGWHQ